MGWLKYVIIFLLPVVMVLLIRTQVDNDSWFVLAEGREIVDNGIYKTDALSMHGDLEVVVQNYGFAVIFWLIYSVFGLAGLYLGMILMYGVVEWLLYKIFRLITEENEVLTLILMTIASVLLGAMFVTTRAQMVSYAIFLAVVYILERYVKKGEKKWLAAIPFLSLVQINLHGSVWLMLFLVMGAFILDSRLENYKAKPLIITAAASFALGLVNPYGVDMILFVLKSYSGGTIQRLVMEMQPFDLGTWYNFVLYGAIAMVILMGFYGKGKDVKARYLMMFIGLLGLGLNTLKGMSQVILVMFLPVAGMYRKAVFPKLKNRKVIRGMFWGEAVLAVVTVGVFGWVLKRNLAGLREAPDDALVEAVNILDGEVAAEERKTVRVYTGYNDGGYLEFRGYRPYLDPRAEVFLEVNNKKEDILTEYIDLREGRGDKEKFLEKYEFDYLVVRGEYDLFYRDEVEGFERIFADEETQTRLYRRAESVI